jgi:hypothetical protein
MYLLSRCVGLRYFRFASSCTRSGGKVCVAFSRVFQLFFVLHSAKRRTEQLRYAGKSVPSTALPRLDNLKGLPVILHFTSSHE